MTRRSKYSLPLPNLKSRLTPAFNPHKASDKTKERRISSRFLGGPPLRAA